MKPATIAYWSSIDWRKPTKQIADETGHTVVAINMRRKEFAPLSVQKRGRPSKPKQPRVLNPRKARWLAVDWTKRDEVIADELGVGIKAVHYQRYKRGMVYRTVGIPYKNNLNHQANIEKWRTWDWKKYDVDLAAEHGISRERVRQIRKMLGKKIINKWTLKSRQFKQWFIDHRHTPMTIKEMMEKSGRCDSVCYKYARELKMKVINAFKANWMRPWDEMDWRLPSSDLGRIWRIKEPVSQGSGFRMTRERSRRGFPMSKWDCRQNLTHNLEYHSAIGAEEAKAEEWFKAHPEKLVDDKARQTV